MSWIGLDLLLDNSCSSNKSCNSSSESAASVVQQQNLQTSTRTTTNWTTSNFVTGDNDGYDFWFYYPDDNENNQNNNNNNTREIDVVPNTIEAERNEHDTNYDDVGSMSSYSTYEGNPPFTTTRTIATTTTTTGNTSANNTSHNNATIGQDTIETDEVTIIVPPGDTLIPNSYLPFTLIPQSITTTLHRNYQIFSPASSTILSNSHTSTNQSQQYNYDEQMIDNNNNSNFNHNNNNGDGDSVGVTIVPSVHSDDNMLIVPADNSTTTTSNTPLGELVMFTSNVSSGVHRTSSRMDRSLPNSFEISSTSRGGGGGDDHIHNNNTMESRDSSLSLHPSSVESSVLTEWASIQEGSGGRPESYGSDPLSTRTTSPGTSAVDHHNPIPTTTLVNERRNRPNNIDEETGAPRYAVTDLFRLHEQQQQNPRTEHDVDSHDDSSELESLTNSFIQEGKRLRQSSNDDNRSHTSSASSPSLEPWYQGFETEQDWDEFRDVAKTVLAAVEDDDVGGAAESDRDRKRANTENTNNEDDDIRLARLIQEEEEVLWRKSEQERISAAATTRTTKSSSATTTTIILDPKRQRVWKLATDVVFVVATAAVAAIGYQVVRQRKR